eukprot:CAMPEP_0198293454 /NCGR_PEP_ID=MMETSP1449-20131203/17329_1 /TAXON_ID=420275 /ORGANISM="Attheya septentrionalis, Strain CCMP2084" /LENGTH=683 /DNA_ID=CAMNT_0043993045 /DNA_START=153 /DNA_END=2204 /DNA_ORIENTATION=-
MASVSSTDVPLPVLAMCCGSTVTTWDGKANFGDSTGLNEFQPHGSNTNISDIAWNHNGQVLATCSSLDASLSSGDATPNVVLSSAALGTSLDSFVSHGGGPTKSVSLAPGTATSIGFGGKSRYICVSNNMGLVSVWDMKKHSRVRIFDIHRSTGRSSGGCSRACFDPTDSLVAALSSVDGGLRLYKLREGKIQSSLASPIGAHGGGVTLGFSSLKQNQAAVGLRNGTVLIWDVADAGGAGSPSPIASFVKRHKSDVTGVCFSPINKLLLATSSLDGSLAFHDINSQKTIQTILVKEHQEQYLGSSAASIRGGGGVTSLSFHADGVTCAAGTQNGIALIYDLRKGASGPLSVYEASPNLDDPMTAIHFSFPTRSSGQKTPKTIKKKAAIVVEEQNTPIETQSLTNSTSAEEVGTGTIQQSPSRRPYEDVAENRANYDEEPMVPSSTTPQISPHRPYDGRTHYDELPLSETNVQVEEMNARELFDHKPDEYVEQHDLPLSPERVNRVSFQEAFTPEPRKPDESEATKYAVGTPYNTEVPVSYSPSLNEGVSNATEMEQTMSDNVESHPVNLTKNMANQQNDADQGSDAYVDALEEQGISESALEMKVSTDVLQKLVNEAVDVLRDDVEGSMHNLHLDVLRQFQQQSNELSAMFAQQRSSIEALLGENKELRAENENLRNVRRAFQ